MSDRDSRVPGVTLKDVLVAVSAFYGVTPHEMKGESREHCIVAARDMFYLLGSRVVGSTSGRMAAWLGGRSRWTVIHSLRRVRVRIDTNPAFRLAVENVECGLRGLQELRVAGRLRSATPREPLDLARLIVSGDDRMAMGVSVEEIRALAAKLLALHGEGEAAPDDTDGAADAAAPPLAALLPEATEPRRAPPAALSDLIHDFLGMEAIGWRTSSPSQRRARDAQIEALRAHGARSAEIHALILAFDAFAQAEFTAAERGAQQRYQDAVRALSKTYSATLKEPANV